MEGGWKGKGKLDVYTPSLKLLTSLHYINLYNIDFAFELLLAVLIKYKYKSHLNMSFEKNITYNIVRFLNLFIYYTKLFITFYFS